MPNISMVSSKPSETTTTSSTPTCGRHFHLFPNSPPEIQLKIWEYAAERPVITIRIRDQVKAAEENQPRYPLRDAKLLCPPQKIAGITLACVDSRRVALKYYGEKYTLRGKWTLSHLHSRWATPPISTNPITVVRYKAERDIVYCPDFPDFIELGHHYDFLGDDQIPPEAGSRDGRQMIRNFALGGIMQRTVFYTHLGNTGPFGCQFGMMQYVLSSFLEKFERLKLLIIVHPTVAELAAMSSSWNEYNHSGGLVGSKDENLIREGLTFVMQDLVGQLQGHPYGQSDRSNASSYGKTHTIQAFQARSELTITFMTEDEFESEYLDG